MVPLLKANSQILLLLAKGSPYSPTPCKAHIIHFETLGFPSNFGG